MQDDCNPDTSYGQSAYLNLDKADWDSHTLTWERSCALLCPLISANSQVSTLLVTSGSEPTPFLVTLNHHARLVVYPSPRRPRCPFL